MAIPNGSQRFGCYTLLALVGSIYLALVNVIGLVQVPTAVKDVVVSYPAWLRAGTSLLWAIGFAALAVGLLRRSAFGLKWFAPLLTVYGGWEVLWLAVFARADFDRGRIGFQLALTGLVLAVIWALRLRQINRPH